MSEWDAASLPARPPSVAEWEDLLVRYELMPRALRVTLEEFPRQRAALAEALRPLVDREAQVAAWLRTATALGVGDAGEAAVSGPHGTDKQRSDPGWLADRFASLRMRNFAMLQRRGLEVWDWRGRSGTGEEITAYQVVAAGVRSDADALAMLRDGARLGAAGPC